MVFNYQVQIPPILVMLILSPISPPQTVLAPFYEIFILYKLCLYNSTTLLISNIQHIKVELGDITFLKNSTVQH